MVPRLSHRLSGVRVIGVPPGCTEINLLENTWHTWDSDSSDPPSFCTLLTIWSFRRRHRFGSPYSEWPRALAQARELKQRPAVNKGYESYSISQSLWVEQSPSFWPPSLCFLPSFPPPTYILYSFPSVFGLLYVSRALFLAARTFLAWECS